jgi:L-2-hydroxyglutarate oxidase LhgO
VEGRFDTVVIGAGVVGLAVARALALRGMEVLVVERHPLPAQETSSRNSGVVHSGIYYPSGSLKARLCVAGRELLYAYAERRGIEHRRCGKLIVAQAGQQGDLEALHARACANGVEDLQFLTEEQVHAYEPLVRCAAGIWCPSTGIIEVHDLVLALLADIEAANGTVIFQTSVEAVDLASDVVSLRCRSAGEEMEIGATRVINCAGLEAVAMLEVMRGYPPSMRRKPWFAKGNYFSLGGARPFRHLVYPMPNEAGLGIHATLDLDGSVRFGPNVQWVEQPEYDVDATHGAEFYSSVRSYWPGLPDGALQPAYAGVRPKLVGPGEKATDFVIEGPAQHGCAGLVNLLGIESPGLTSCLAIGELVAAMG